MNSRSERGGPAECSRCARLPASKTHSLALRALTLRGFTLVELLVVISIIILILGIGIPGLSRMLGEVRANAGIQSVSGMLTRAYFTAEAQSNWIAVRAMPGAWDFSSSGEPNEPSNRQHLVIYERRADRRNPSNGQLVAPNPNNTAADSQLTEYFARMPASESLVLPEDVWLAPGELLSTGFAGTNFAGNFAAGTPGRVFEIDPAPAVADGMLKMDDFLLIFEPGQGLRISRVPPPAGGSVGFSERHMLQGYVPSDPNITIPDLRGFARGSQTLGSWVPSMPLREGGFHRFAFSSLAFYRRSAFIANEDRFNGAAQPAERQRWLRENARAFAIPPQGGGLIEGPSATQ